MQGTFFQSKLLLGHAKPNKHQMNHRAEATNFMLFKHSLLLFKTYNARTPNEDWLDLNF